MPLSLSRLSEGLACVASVAGIWVGAAALTQYVFVDEGVATPTLLTTINSIEFPVILLPLSFLRERGCSSSRGSRCVRMLAARPSDWRAAARAAALVCPLWVLAQGSYNASLQGTTVSSSTVLSSTSCVFTFALATWCLRQPTTRLTAGGVLFTVAGATLVGWADEAEPGDSDSAAGTRHAWWGDALAVASAVGYALYSNAIKAFVPEEVTMIEGAPFVTSAAHDPPHGVMLPTKVVVVANAGDGDDDALRETRHRYRGDDEESYDDDETPSLLKRTIAAPEIVQAGAEEGERDALLTAPSFTASCAATATTAAAATTTAAAATTTTAAASPSPPPSISTPVFFGFLGLFTTCALAPLVALFHFTGVEDVSSAWGHPSRGTLLILVLTKGLLDNVASDLLWARAIQLTNPTLAAVGLSLTIPLALASDFFLRGTIPSGAMSCGAAIVAIGFILCALGARGSTSDAATLVDDHPVDDGHNGTLVGGDDSEGNKC